MQVYAQDGAGIPWAALHEASGQQIADDGGNFIGAFLGRALPYILTLAGLTLLVMIIWGGFTMLTNPTNPEAQQKGKLRLTWSIIGFIVVFLSYWFAQILEVIFNLDIV